MQSIEHPAVQSEEDDDVDVEEVVVEFEFPEEGELLLCHPLEDEGEVL